MCAAFRGVRAGQQGQRETRSGRRGVGHHPGCWSQKNLCLRAQAFSGAVEDIAEGAGGGPEGPGRLVGAVGGSILTITFEGVVDGWAKVASLRGPPQRHLIGEVRRGSPAMPTPPPPQVDPEAHQLLAAFLGLLLDGLVTVGITAVVAASCSWLAMRDSAD